MKNSLSWKIAQSSVQGVSHIRSNQPCQDAVQFSVESGRFCMAMADGAGSAAFAEKGSQEACRVALAALEKSVHSFESWKAEEWKSCLTQAAATSREAVFSLAKENGHAVKSYATTLILLVATPTGAAALQIGDGAIVLLDRNDEMKCLTTPVETEYLNETVFLTGENVLENAQFKMEQIGLKAVAALTDGLQLLALKMPGATPHPPFFQPLFRFAAAENNSKERDDKLAGFLRSPKISQRADDDLTLLLAVLEGDSPLENLSS